MASREKGTAKPSDRRTSFVRQTRSQTAAAAARNAEGVNLEISEDDAVQQAFEPSVIDETGGDKNDCPGCERPNNAELYMVECGLCKCCYHFTCAKVDTATVKEKPFFCASCLPPEIPPSVSTSRSSARSTRIARELQRLEEERQLQEEEMRRKQAYIEKKYELLKQQDEAEERSSLCSYRTNRTKSDRVQDWVEGQKMATVAGQNAANEKAKPADLSLLVVDDSVEQLGANLNSTPLSESKAAAQICTHETLESGISTIIVDPSKPSASVEVEEEIPTTDLIPLVDIRPIISHLDGIETPISQLGVKPKTVRVEPPNYEQWKLQSNRPVYNAPKAKHEKDLEFHKKREFDLVNRVKALEKEREEQLDLQRQREVLLKGQLQRKEKEQAEFLEKASQAAVKRKAEIERLRKTEKDLVKQLEAMRLSKLKAKDDNHVQDGGQQNSGVSTEEQAKQQPVPDDNAGEVNTYPGNQPTGTEKNPVNPSLYTFSTPIGTRSYSDDCGSWSSWSWSSLPASVPDRESTPVVSPLSLPYPPQQGFPNAASRGTGAVWARTTLTPEQSAARHVVNKALPKFSGDSSEWPVFFSTYQNSTQLCGFSNSENILRLQSALVGEARKLVSSMLLDPLRVPEVMYSLQLRYGRPEQIIHSLIQEIQETPAPKDFDSLTTFGLMVQNFCGHLKALNMEKHLANPELLKQLVKKLPSHVTYNWALYQQSLPEANLLAFGEYMARVAVATSSVAFPEDKPKTAKASRPKSKEKAFVNTHNVDDEEVMSDTGELVNAHILDTGSSKDYQGEASKEQSIHAVKKSDTAKSCSMCNAGHQLGDCMMFKKLSLDERWTFVKQKKLCRRCLNSHSRYSCKGKPCDVSGCQARHHRLLHNDQPRGTTTSDKTDSTKTSDETITVHRQLPTTTLFRVLPVTLFGTDRQVDTFAFLDDGSSVTLVERKLAESLGLEGQDDSLCIHWTGGIKKHIEDTQMVTMSISGAERDKQFKVRRAYTVDDLGLPPQTMDYDTLAEQFPHLANLPVQSLKSAVPGILIGLSNTRLLAPTKKAREGEEEDPIATKTRLGWTIYGSPGEEENLPHRQLHICERQEDLDLHEYVREFFAIESLGVITPVRESMDEQRAYKILAETTKRTESGRFETGLLWKQDYVELPDSKSMAKKRLQCLEKRLARDPELYDNVRQQIANFQMKGYAHEATEKELASFDLRRTWYLPLGVVTNPKKPGKVRVIWDAAAKVDGVSLNTMLLKGPDLLTPLLRVLFQFRERQIAICADIEAMFHQVLIRLIDRCAQLFLWRDTSDMPLKTFVTDVAIFGATCSPTHSQFVKNLNASEHAKEFPKAAEAIQRKHYVDDYLDSVDTPEEAAILALDVARVHAKAGFNIRNWISNDKSVLQKVGEVNPATVKRFVIDKESGFERVLGIVWLPDEDVFSFSLNFRDDLQELMAGKNIPTKRQLLSVVMSLYDPPGLVASFVVYGKIIIQDVWRAKVDWDKLIPGDIFSRWKLWLIVLQKLNTVKIPRCYFPNYHPDDLKSLELHIFVDASEQAYAAVAYFRIVNQAGHVRCALVAAKTKVAPLQPLSIPRLELLAAVLGTRLRCTICESHSLTISKVHMWSDSRNTLTWIRATDLRRYRPYVAFRVNEILTTSKVNEWRWVPTRFNVADEATKWNKGPSFDSSSRWYKGPEFLYEKEENWPKDRKEAVNEAPEELRPAFVFHHFVKQPLVDFERFSKWERLLRSIAYSHRFIDNCKRHRDGKPKEVNEFSRDELLKSERSLWLLAQSDGYPDEVAVLHRNLKLPAEKRKSLDKSTSLRKLAPALDEFGVLRAQNRIDAAECVGYDAKHPIILPRNHRVTYLLVDYYHRRLKHRNNETVVNEIRQRFDIPKLRVVVSMVARRCMRCRVYKAEPVMPRMGPLPRARLMPFVRPFTFTGVDYFGPYLIKIGRSAVKRWVAVFTCLTLRAVHLEKVASLSTDSCKKAIRRFVDRRGHPQEIYSDRGTNFVGASRELELEIKKMNQELASTFTDTHTQWRFIPPATPHMGGCWERMVRSIKTALDVVPSDRKLDDESFATLLTDAENMVNSRPLTFVSLENADQEALTPNHFLLMSSSGVVQPVKTPVNDGAALRSSWNHIQHILDSFWRRWVLEYLPTIARRTKWFEDVKPIEVGRLVVAVDEDVRNHWLRGEVVRTFPDTDGRVRQVDVRTADGKEIRKSVARIAVLDVEEDGDACAES